MASVLLLIPLFMWLRRVAVERQVGRETGGRETGHTWPAVGGESTLGVRNLCGWVNQWVAWWMVCAEGRKGWRWGGLTDDGITLEVTEMCWMRRLWGERQRPGKLYPYSVLWEGEGDRMMGYRGDMAEGSIEHSKVKPYFPKKEDILCVLWMEIAIWGADAAETEVMSRGQHLCKRQCRRKRSPSEWKIVAVCPALSNFLLNSPSTVLPLSSGRLTPTMR